MSNRGNYEDRHTPETGKRTICRLCGGWINTEELYIRRGNEYEHMPSSDCNPYLNYYGPGKPID